MTTGSLFGRFVLVFGVLTLVGCSDMEVAGLPGEACDLSYDLPGDIPGDIPGALVTASQSGFEQYSWQSFFAVNAPRVGGEI
ncbi:MAG: hypothetical protein P8R42_27100 [Candidatus Binatia bacterium]|nr:hypothetical protein [Candidatus Binatia bacterium]